MSLCWFRQSYSARLAKSVTVQCASMLSGDLTHTAIMETNSLFRVVCIVFSLYYIIILLARIFTIQSCGLCD